MRHVFSPSIWLNKLLVFYSFFFRVLHRRLLLGYAQRQQQPDDVSCLCSTPTREKVWKRVGTVLWTVLAVHTRHTHTKSRTTDVTVKSIFGSYKTSAPMFVSRETFRRCLRRCLFFFLWLDWGKNRKDCGFSLLALTGQGHFLPVVVWWPTHRRHSIRLLALFGFVTRSSTSASHISPVKTRKDLLKRENSCGWSTSSSFWEGG